MTINCNDPMQPNIIWARDFSNPVGRIKLVSHGETVRTWAEAFGSAAKMGEYCGLVHGVWRNKIGTNDILSDGLLNPTAIFRGLRRPLYNLSLDADGQIFVYITNPPATYLYPRETRFSGGPMIKLPAPIDSVFATYVTFERAHVDGESRTVALDSSVQGVVVGWEWLERSLKAPMMPYDYDSRFDSRVS